MSSRSPICAMCLSASSRARPRPTSLTRCYPGLGRPHRPRPPSRADARGAVATLTVRIVALETVDAPTQRPSDHFFRWIGGRDRFFFSNFGGAGAADRRMAASAARFAVSIGSDSSANRGRPKRGIWLYTEARRIEAIVSVIIHGQVGYQDSPPVPVTILFRPEPFIAPVQS